MRRLLFVLPLLLLGADFVHMDDTTRSFLGPIPNCTAEAETLGYDEATESFECNTDGGGGGNSFGTIGAAIADVGADTLTVTDSATIDFTTTDGPEDLTAGIVADSVSAAQLNSAGVETELEGVLDILDLQDGSGLDSCVGDDVVKRNAGDTAFECAAVAGGSGLSHPQVMTRVSLGY